MRPVDLAALVAQVVFDVSCVAGIAYIATHNGAPGYGIALIVALFFVSYTVKGADK